MVASSEVIEIPIEKLFLRRLPPEVISAFLECTKNGILNEQEWYLAGGTALALQVGHRQSVDLDFFTNRKNFDEISLERDLLATENWRSDFRERGTIHTGPNFPDQYIMVREVAPRKRIGDAFVFV